MPEPRSLTLCADDFGLAPGICTGIAQLAHMGRLSWASCIVNGSCWSTHAALLPQTGLRTGLHINLTEGKPLSRELAAVWPQLPSLPTLMLRAHLGRLPQAALHAEIHAQLAAFKAIAGHAPAFVDGHQHVHHLPGLRRLVLDMAQHIVPRPMVRNTGRLLGPGFATKRWLIARSGGRALERALLVRRLPHNRTLAGAYDLRARDYRALMQGWLARLPAQGALLFCHPAEQIDGPGAAHAQARFMEFAYLSSDAFARDLEDAHVVLEAGGLHASRPARSARRTDSISETSTAG